MADIRPRSLAYAPKDGVKSKAIHSILDTRPTVRAEVLLFSPINEGNCAQEDPAPIATLSDLSILRQAQDTASSTGWLLSLSKGQRGGKGAKAEVTSGFVSTFRHAQGPQAQRT